MNKIQDKPSKKGISYEKEENAWNRSMGDPLISNSRLQISQQMLRSWMTARPEIPAFLLILTVLLWLNLNRTDFRFYYDADIYWHLRFEFDQNGTVPFSLSNYNEPLRGYLLPLLYYMISRTADVLSLKDVILLEIVHALIYSLIITVIIPRTVKALYHCETSAWQLLVFSFLVIFFWQGHFYYPLSDFGAVFFFALGTFLILYFGSNWPATILTGMAWAGAAAVRPSYQITLIPLLLWAAYYHIKEIRLKVYPALLRWLAILAGFVLVFIPQININLLHFGVFSPLPQTQLYYGENLFTKQLGWGIVIQKYETTIGSSHPTAGVIFLDRQGENILVETGFKSDPYSISKRIIPDRFPSYGEYAWLVLNYPLDFISIYMRHFFNGLDIIYNTVYIEDIYSNSILLRLINYSLWFLVVLYVLRKWKLQKYGISRFFLPLILALPSLLSIPTAMEVRFMLPLHLMTYALVTFWILPKFTAMSFEQKTETVRKYIVWYLIFVVFCFMISSNTYMNLVDGNYLLSGN